MIVVEGKYYLMPIEQVRARANASFVASEYGVWYPIRKQTNKYILIDVSPYPNNKRYDIIHKSSGLSGKTLVDIYANRLNKWHEYADYKRAIEVLEALPDITECSAKQILSKALGLLGV